VQGTNSLNIQFAENDYPRQQSSAKKCMAAIQIQDEIKADGEVYCPGFHQNGLLLL